MKETLGQLLQNVSDLARKPGGTYILCIPCDVIDDLDKLSHMTLCVLYYVTRDEDMQGFVPPDNEMCEFFHVSLVQEIVLSAKETKPNATAEELVHCLVYYFQNDAFYIFS